MEVSSDPMAGCSSALSLAAESAANESGGNSVLPNVSKYPHHSSNLVPPVFRPQCTSSLHHSVPFLSSLQADVSAGDASGESQPLLVS